MNSLKVALFEDKADLQEVIAQVLKDEEGIDFCGAWENCDHVKRIMDIYRPDIVLMDIEMPGTNGIEGLKIIKQYFPDIDVLMLTVFDDDYNVFEAMCYGASGYLLKNTGSEKIIEAIYDLQNGGAPMTASVAKKVLQLFSKNVPKPHEQFNLTQREKDILGSLVKGNSYKMIASEQKISIETVRTHIKKIYDKLHVHSMNEAVAKAIKQRLV
jgi:DNA-binding NarL/FixJ family response regulator